MCWSKTILRYLHSRCPAGSKITSPSKKTCYILDGKIPMHVCHIEENGYETRQISLLYVIVQFYALDPAQNTYNSEGLMVTHTYFSFFWILQRGLKFICNSFVLLLALTSAFEFGSSPYKGMSIGTKEFHTVSIGLFPRLRCPDTVFSTAIPKISISSLAIFFNRRNMKIKPVIAYGFKFGTMYFSKKSIFPWKR